MQEVNQSAASVCSTEYVPREVIAEQLLIALDDKSKTAIIAGKEDIEILIRALDHVPSFWGTRYITMASDLRKLRDSAFP